MSQVFPIAIPDEVLDFKGSATELADLCNQLLQDNGLEDGEVANERLVRHYVSVEVLTPPVRQGREAVYGARQAAEFVIARKLLKDGWPLAKIAELIQTYDLPIPALQESEPELPTEAERAIARIRASQAAPDKVSRRRAPPINMSMPSYSRDEPPQSDSLARAAGLAARRMGLAETLRELGNESGTVEREEMVQLRLTPWATVYVDARELRRLGPAEAEALGKALAEALREARMTRGERK
jgi:DNA-binding transcriptional MerR regulator